MEYKYVVVTRNREDDSLLEGEKFEYYSDAKSYLNELRKEYSKEVYYDLEEIDEKGSFGEEE